MQIKSWMMIAGVVFCLCTQHVLANDDSCKEDIKKFCADAKSAGAIKKCLKEHRAEVSDTCKNNASTLKAKVLGASQACKSDAEKFCSGEKGPARVKHCLKQHMNDLSAMCKAEFAGLKGLKL